MKYTFIIEYEGDLENLSQYFGEETTKILLNGRTKILNEVQND